MKKWDQFVRLIPKWRIRDRVKPLDRKCHVVFTVFPWVLAAMEYLYVVYKYLIDGTEILNSDMSAEMMLANLLNQEGDWFLSKGWYYSTELRVVNTQLIYRIGLSLFSDWHLARTFSIALLLIIFMGSFFYFAKQAGLKNLGVWAAIFMLCPMSARYAWIILVGCFYIPHLSMIFLSLGLMLKTNNRSGESSPWKKAVPAVILCCIGFIAGLNGVRLIQNCYLPVLLTVIAVSALNLQADVETKKIGQLMNTAEGTICGSAILALLSACAGFAVNSLYLQQIYSFMDFNKTQLMPFHFSQLLDHFGDMSSIFGYKEGAVVFSVAGIGSLSSELWVFLIIAAILISLAIYKKLTFSEQIIVVFALVSLLINLMIDTVVGRTHAYYLIPNAIFFFIVISILLSKIPVSKKRLKRAAYGVWILLLGIMLANRSFDVSQMVGVNINGLQDATAWLQENGYSQGYARFWNSGTAVELSNNELDIWTLDKSDWKSGELYAWLQEKRHFETAPSGEVFLLLDDQECSELPADWQSAHVVYSEYNYTIYSFDSADKLMLALKD